MSNEAEQAHVDSVAAVMARVYRRAGVSLPAQEKATPLDQLMAKDELQPEDHYDAGVDMLGRFIDWVFEQGPEPANAVQRLYSVTNALRPALLLHMSGEELAAIFGQGRAAESARTVMLNKKLKAAGFRHTSFRHQKSETARRRMSAAALGNKNRKRGRKKSSAIE